MVTSADVRPLQGRLFVGDPNPRAAAHGYSSYFPSGNSQESGYVSNSLFNPKGVDL